MNMAAAAIAVVTPAAQLARRLMDMPTPLRFQWLTWGEAIGIACGVAIGCFATPSEPRSLRLTGEGVLTCGDARR